MLQELVLDQGKFQPEKNKKRRPLKVNQIVPLGFGSILVLSGILTAISQVTTDNLQESENLVGHTFEVKQELTRVEKSIIEAETGQRGFVLTGREEYLAPYDVGSKAYRQQLANLQKLILVQSLRPKVDTLNKLAEQRFALMAEIVELKKTGKDKEALALILTNRGQNISNQIRTQVDEIDKEENKVLEERKQATEQADLWTTILIWGGWLVSVGAGVYVSLIVSRQIMRPIIDAAKAVASSSSGIASTVSMQESTILEQTSSVNETTSSIEELGAFTLQSAEQAEVSAGGAKQALSLAESGTQTVGRTIEGIAGLRDQVTAIANQIIRLSEQTSQISTVSDLVADLANQTNMLALNAGVEAARAGEQGKGFAVVASEIRKLADQSKKSANQINSLVNEVQAAINSTVMVTDEGTKKATVGIELAEEAGEVFASIADSVNHVFLNTQLIAQSAKQQAVSVQQVIAAMNVINLGAKETATGIIQVKDATNDLNTAAQNLEAVV